MWVTRSPASFKGKEGCGSGCDGDDDASWFVMLLVMISLSFAMDYNIGVANSFLWSLSSFDLPGVGCYFSFEVLRVFYLFFRR